MNFTKEYIDLCKNPKVQGLRPELIHFDFYSDDPPHSIGIWSCEAIKKYSGNRKTILWLPTGDQIDQCIVDICKEQSIDYIFKYLSSEMEFKTYVTGVIGIKDGNPLICKIKLLISLLEEE